MGPTFSPTLHGGSRLWSRHRRRVRWPAHQCEPESGLAYSAADPCDVRCLCWSWSRSRYHCKRYKAVHRAKEQEGSLPRTGRITGKFCAYRVIPRLKARFSRGFSHLSPACRKNNSEFMQPEQGIFRAEQGILCAAREVVHSRPGRPVLIELTFVTVAIRRGC